MFGARSSSQRPAAIMASMAARRAVFGSVAQGGWGRRAAEGIEARWLNVGRGGCRNTDPKAGAQRGGTACWAGLMDKRAVCQQRG